MTFARIAAALAVLLLSACAFIAPLQPASTFYVMRHLETAPGTADPGLTPRGQQQAQLLAGWFGAEPPVTIMVSNTRRARETAAPLAARLGVTPIVYDPGDAAALVGEILKEPAPVLIVGHSNTVPDIVQRLSGRRVEAIGHDAFGDIFQISGSRVLKRDLESPDR
nr:phosphoglycerate mutase family protein [uncultured Sphingosinicella sp.]